MNKPAALYARVSSDRQKENHTIASQVAALTQYAETNGYLIPPEWQFQDDGYSGATLVRPGLEALRHLAAGGTDPNRPYLLARSLESEICLSSFVGRRVGPRWSGAHLSASALRRYRRRSVAGPVSRDDCGIRTGTDCRAFSPWQAAPRSPGLDQCAVGRPLRLSLREEDRYFGGLLRSGGVRGRGGASHLRCLYAARPQHWRHSRLTQPTRGADADATEPMGTPHHLEEVA